MDKAIKYLLTVYLAVTIVSALLLPPLNFISFDNLLFPLAGLAVLQVNYRNKVFWISAGLIGLITLSSLLSNFISGGITSGEILWSVRWVKLFTLGWSVHYLMHENRTTLQSFIILGFLGMVIINALQLIGVDAVIDLYASKQEATVSLTRSLLDGRMFGTVLNPNNNGLLLSLFAVFFLGSNIRWKYVYVVISGLLILMTQSRTAFVALVCVVGILILFYLWKRSKKQLLIFLLGSAVALFALVQLKFTNLSSLFDGSAFHSNSLKKRYEVVHNVVETNADSMFFGQGKVNNIPELIGGSIDNEYFYVYLEYGVLGLISLFGVLMLLTGLSLRVKISPGNIGLLVVMLICGLTNLSFSNLEIGATFIILFVALLALAATKKDEIHH